MSKRAQTNPFGVQATNAAPRWLRPTWQKLVTLAGALGTAIYFVLCLAFDRPTRAEVRETIAPIAQRVEEFESKQDELERRLIVIDTKLEWIVGSLTTLAEREGVTPPPRSWE